MKSNERVSLLAVGVALFALGVAAKGLGTTRKSSELLSPNRKNVSPTSVNVPLESKRRSLFGVPLWDSPEDMRRSNVKRAKAHIDLLKNLLVGAGFAITVSIFFASSNDVINQEESILILGAGLTAAVIFCAWAVNVYVLELEIFRPLIRTGATLVALLVVGAILITVFDVTVTHAKKVEDGQKAKERALQTCNSNTHHAGNSP